MAPSEIVGSMTVPQALGRLRVALDDAYTQSARQVGLTAQQAELLCAALQPAAVGDLARALRCDRSNVSRLVDRAARQDLVRRAAADDDGRVTIIELSPQGRSLAEAFIARLESRTRALIATWNDERRQTAVGVLTELADAIDSSRGDDVATRG